MTTSRKYDDSEGDFSAWHESERRCPRLVDDRPCNAPVLYREWESSDGAYVDYQYRCEVGHVFWIDGIDS